MGSLMIISMTLGERESEDRERERERERGREREREREHTLAQVAQPIFTTVARWIYDGELDDNYHEVRERGERRGERDRGGMR